MKRNALSRALSKAKPFVAKLSALPVLGNVALYTDNGKVWIEGSNLETACRIPVAHTGEFEGTTIEHKTLSKIVNSLDCAELDFANEDGHLVITGTRTKAELPGIDIEEFPVIPRKADKVLAVMGAGVLKQVATLVAPSAASNSGRPALECVCLELSKEGVLFIAADGFMLSKLDIAANGQYAAVDDEVTFLVPARAWKAIAGLASSANEDVTLGAILDKEGEPCQAMFMFESGIQAVVILGDYTFPDWRDIMPKEFTGDAFPKNLETAIKPLLAFAGCDYLRSTWIFSKNGLHISVKGEDGASMAREVEAYVRGLPLDIDFDLILVQRLLKRATDWRGLSLQYSTSFAPVVFDMGNFVTAVMPMRDR